MASKNVETLIRAHKFFNSRKLKECANELAQNCIYHDLPRSKDWPQSQFVEFMEGWIRGFSDCQIIDPNYIDAGETVICEFKARGTNDGPLGTFPATQKRLELPYCEVVHFDKQGKIREVTAYYDMLTLLGQLGHLKAPREIEMAAH
jgi:steroid delta-isomerase-like uncharacterized protein